MIDRLLTFFLHGDRLKNDDFNIKIWKNIFIIKLCKYTKNIAEYLYLSHKSKYIIVHVIIFHLKSSMVVIFFLTKMLSYIIIIC